ncbi:MAG: peptide-methionine (R)-S-oxide reductase [Polaribacter sp.]|jgi:peptide-methionine (R)-S-oxide reductase
MKKFILLMLIGVLYSCTANAQQQKAATTAYKIVKTDTEWKHLLSPAQYNVLRKSGTEKPFAHPFNTNKAIGTYVCAACQTPLYKSIYKYDSKSGWPSFDRAIKKNVELDVDYKIGYARTELKCNTCGGHLGHSFEDGPRKTTGIRHCINGAALQFIPEK